MIEIENLRLTIKGNAILEDINLHLRPGDIYGLLGPNGAGKSTTLFALLGFRRYADGHMRVLQADPARDAVSIRRQVGVMPEKAGFYEWMTAPDYLKWYGRLYDSPSTDRDVNDVLGRVGLAARTHFPIGTFSRGMKQRLAVARALIGHPKLLILDEPTNGLDPKGRREIHELLVEFAAEGKTGVLLCTHLLDDVDRLCNRIGIIEQGRTRIEGTMADLLARQRGVQRHHLRLASAPGIADLPEGVVVLGHRSNWWHVQTPADASEDVSTLWAELYRRDWRILEIRSEAASLEDLYLHHTGQDRPYTREAA